MATSIAPSETTLPKGPFKESFSIEYDGPNENNFTEVDAESLAASISGFSVTAKKIAKETLNLDISVNIVANKEGCFEVVCSIVGFVGGVFGILQWFGYDYNRTQTVISGIILKAASVINEILVNSEGDVEIVLAQINSAESLTDTEKLHLAKLVSDRKFQAALDDFTRILENKDVSDIAVKQKGAKIFGISKVQRPTYVLINPEEISTTHRIMRVKIIYLSPTETIWQFLCNKMLFWAEVEDGKFLSETKDIDIAHIKGTVYIASVTTISIRKRGAKRATVEHRITNIAIDDRNLLNHTA